MEIQGEQIIQLVVLIRSLLILNGNCSSTRIHFCTVNHFPIKKLYPNFRHFLEFLHEPDGPYLLNICKEN